MGEALIEDFISQETQQKTKTTLCWEVQCQPWPIENCLQNFGVSAYEKKGQWVSKYYSTCQEKYKKWRKKQRGMVLIRSIIT